MKKIIIPVITVLFYSVGFSQGIDGILYMMEKNNPTFKSIDKWLVAEKTGAEIGLTPPDPEISFDYLIGNDAIGGNQYEFEVIQSVKLPKYYKTKAEINTLNFQSQEAYAVKKKREILHLFRSTYIYLVMLKEREKYFEDRYKKANDLVSSVEKAMAEGFFAKLDYDKALVYSMNTLNDLQENKLEIESLNKRLVQLNGGVPIDDLVYEYPVDWELLNLDTLQKILVDNNVDIRISKLDKQDSEMEIKYQRINNLPSFEIGYKSERIFDQALRGFHAGLSIPLYENAKKTKYAKLRKEWMDSEYDQLINRLMSELMICHNEATALQQNYQRVESILDEKIVQKNAMELLEVNQITIQEYLLNLDLMHEFILNYYVLKNQYFLKLLEIKTLVGS